jgi:hypothetical protein
VGSSSTVHGEEVTSRGEIGRRTRGGGAHREAAAATMTARLAARSGRGMDVGVDERSTVRGGLARGALRGMRGGGDETGTAASGGAPFEQRAENRGRGASCGEDATRSGHGAWPRSAGEGGRREARGPTREKKRSGASPGEQ